MFTLIITGTAGFIGSVVRRYLRSYKLARVMGIDVMPYTASRAALDSLEGDPDFHLIEAAIDDSRAIMKLLWETQQDGIMHLAAETHVDRAIDDPGAFLHANILGAYTLLETSKHYLCTLPEDARRRFRLHHVSTDEVYGSICATVRFTEDTLYKNLIEFVMDRPAHDERYTVDFSKLKNELGWSPRTSLSGGSRKTVARSLANRSWCESIRARKHGGEGLGQLRRTGTT